MTDRDILLRRIQVCDFVLNDTALFLDVNPDHEDALAYYKKYQGMRALALKAFVEKYGPISRGDYNGGPHWAWGDNPWPWQLEEV